MKTLEQHREILLTLRDKANTIKTKNNIKKALSQINKAIYYHNDIKLNWDVVQDKVLASKIKRFDYKTLLGESLTEYITKRTHLTNEEILKEVMREINIVRLINFNPNLRYKLIHNVNTSISARRAEQQAHLNRLTK